MKNIIIIPLCLIFLGALSFSGYAETVENADIVNNEALPDVSAETTAVETNGAVVEAEKQAVPEEKSAAEPPKKKDSSKAKKTNRKSQNDPAEESFAINPEARPGIVISTETPKGVTIEIERVKDAEKLSLDVELPKEKVINEVFQGKSEDDSPFLHYDLLHRTHGNFTDKSSVRLDLVEAGSYDEPPENYIYVTDIDTPSIYKGWDLKVVSSRGEILWNVNGRSSPPKKIAWNGRDENDEWKAMIGEQYSFIFRGYNKETKKYEYWEKTFRVDSYMYDRGGGSVIRFSARAIFDDRGTQLTDRGRRLLKKVFFKIKTYKFRSGFMEIRSTNPELAKFQLEEVVEYAKKNLVDMNALAVSTAEIADGISYFDILLSRTAKR